MNDLSVNNNKIWPWTRFVARVVDCSIISSIFFILLSLIFKLIHIHYSFTPNFNHYTSLKEEFTNIIRQTIAFAPHLILQNFVLLTIYMFIDAAICKKFGRNIGHKILGLHITNQTGHALTYKDYLKRSFLVCAFYFLNIFYIPTIIYYINYKKNGTTYWDRLSNMAVTSKNASSMRTGLLISLYFNFSIIVAIIINIVVIIYYVPKIHH